MQAFFKQHIWSFIVIAAVAVLAFQNAWNMYFWHDDYSYLYYAQNNQLNKYPYHFFTIWNNLLYQFFGLNHRAYLAVGIGLYVIAGFLLYFFLIKAFKKKLLALIGALVFASGYTGQDSIKMLLGDGIPTLIGIIFFLASLLAFINYKSSQKMRFLLLSFLLFFLILELLPSRCSGSFIIFIGIDWVLSSKEKFHFKEILVRNAVFLTIFLVQFLIHPSKFILNYSLVYANGTQILSLAQILGIIKDFQLRYLLIPFGTFWNHFFPLDYQIDLTFLTKHFPSNHPWVQSLPSLLIVSVMITLIKVLRPQVFTLRKVFFYMIFFLFLSELWAVISTLASVYPSEQISILNGGIFFIFLITLLWLKIPAFPGFAIMSVLIIFGGISVFFVVKPEFVIESFDRYLLPTAVAVPLTLSFFLPKELLDKRAWRKKIPGLVMFLLPVVLLIGSHMMLGATTQKEFVNNYSNHARIYFADLKKYLPQISGKKIIYVEGSTKNLSFAVGDAARVGELGSEAAYAVQYDTSIKNILLPESPEGIVSLLRKNSDVEVKDVYYFIYTIEGLKNLSEEFQVLINSGNRSATISPSDWRKRDKGLVIGTKFPSQLPIKVKFTIKAEPGANMKVPSEEEVKIIWQYDTIGPLAQDDFVKLTVPTDNFWHTREFLIPGGGEYLTEIAITDISYGRLDLGETTLLNVK